MKFEWFPYEGGFRCELPDGVSLNAVPDRFAKGLTPKAARGAKWRACVNRWDGKSTLSRYGRDEYMNLQDSAQAAMRLAEDVFLTA